MGRLLVVEKNDTTGLVAPTVQKDGSCELIDPKDVDKQYHEAIGRNTKYIIHPEETCADNFAFLVTGLDVPDKELQKRFERVLLTLSTPGRGKSATRSAAPSTPSPVVAIDPF